MYFNNYYGTGPGQMGPAVPNPYGYGQAPGMSGLGYYEQRTPAGSFAAAEWGGPTQQQFGQSYTASNPFIGQTTQGIGGQQSVMPYAQQSAQLGQQANPWLGGQAQQAQQVGPNAYGGGNPFLGQAIDAASADARRNFDLSVRPALDAADRASGSFGNTAVAETRANAYGDFGRHLGNIASGMRMQDYAQQQQLAENALNRQQQTSLFNAQQSSGDLSRNLAGFLSGQGLGLQGLGQALGAAQFDASLGNNVNQFNAGLASGELGRNAQLAQGLGQFNAGQRQGASQFNAGQGNALAQFDSGQRNGMSLANAGAANNMLSQYRNLTEQGRQFDANFGEGQRRYDEGMDFNTWQANVGNMRQGTQDQINLLNTLMGLNTQGLNLANQQQNTPLNYWQQFVNGGTQLSGQGATQTQNLQGNQLLGALGGWQLFSRLFGG